MWCATRRTGESGNETGFVYGNHSDAPFFTGREVTVLFSVFHTPIRPPQCPSAVFQSPTQFSWPLQRSHRRGEYYGHSCARVHRTDSSCSFRRSEKSCSSIATIGRHQPTSAHISTNPSSRSHSRIPMSRSSSSSGNTRNLSSEASIVCPNVCSRDIPTVHPNFAVNDREKVVPLNGFEVTGIESKVQLLLDSSGAVIKPLKRRSVVSTTESVRGIWSGLHDPPFKI